MEPRPKDHKLLIPERRLKHPVQLLKVWVRSIPVGSKAVRESILAYGPPLSLHGHIHEGKGAVKLGSTLAVNPGSAYEDGVLQAAIVDLDEKKGTVKRYLLING